MKKVILDTNFILSCLRERIDLFDALKDLNLKVIIPSQVISELKKLSVSKKKGALKENCKLALKILEKNEFREENLEKNYVDDGLVKFLKKNPEIILASLDKILRKRISNKNLIILSGKRSLFISNS